MRPARFPRLPQNVDQEQGCAGWNRTPGPHRPPPESDAPFQLMRSLRCRGYQPSFEISSKFMIWDRSGAGCSRRAISSARKARGTFVIRLMVSADCKWQIGRLQMANSAIAFAARLLDKVFRPQLSWQAPVHEC